MKRIIFWIAGITLFLSSIAVPVSGQSVPTISIQNEIASGFSDPVVITHAGDNSNRLFIVEQVGRIKIIKNGVVLAQPFLDITNLVLSGGERGLLGLAFHPQYATNGYFYVHYSDRDSGGDTMIARYRVSTTNPDVADPASRFQILTVDQPYSNHNGGQMAFGPDGYLYIALGDGGSGGDPLNNGQNLNTLLGKILRIDINSGTPYRIPSSNPFVNTSGRRGEIWAYGLRNPWKFSFDRSNGDLYLGDVGQNQWEEIDFSAGGSPGGVNYGWRCMEGLHAYTSVAPCNDPNYLAGLTAPIAEYSHSLGASVTGGNVYRGSLYPQLRGRYFYGDFVSGRIWSLTRLPGSSPSFSAPVLELSNTGINISAFGEDQAGEIYVADYTGGTIRRLEAAGGAADFSGSTLAPSTNNANPTEQVMFTILLKNTGADASGLSLSNPLPDGLSYSGGLSASSGTANQSGGTITWSGSVPEGGTVTIQYLTTVGAGVGDGSLLNRAVLTGLTINPLNLGTALWVPRSPLETTGLDFVMPGTQPDGLSIGLQTSVDCDTCHSAPIYNSWRGSVMAQAGRDPLLWSALAVSNAYAPGSGEFCLRCHVNKGWLEGRSTPASGASLTMDDLGNGVACLTCHRMVDVIASPNDEASSIDSLIRSSLTSLPPANTSSNAMLIIDPNDNRRGPFSLANTFAYHSVRRTDLLGQTGSAETRSRLCGSCHNIFNPLLSFDPTRGTEGEYWLNPVGQPSPTFDSSAENRPFPIERTFDEWKLSTYATGGVYAPQFAGSKPNGIVETCQDCHMPRVTGQAADPAFNPITRDCRTTGCLPQHDFLGANTWLPDLLQNAAWRLSAVSDAEYLDNAKAQTTVFLKKAATMEVTMSDPAGGFRQVTVTVVNQTGHKLPTGYPEGRRMWINLRAYDADNNLVYESGEYNSQTGELTLDAAIKVYEAKLGLSPDLADFMNLPAGASFFFSLNNTWIKDNRIPPRGFTNSNFGQDGLRPVGYSYQDGEYWDTTTYSVPDTAVQVIAALQYQTASKEYIDFLRQYGGLDGDALGEMWDSSRSEPVTITYAWTPDHPVYLSVVRR